MDPLTLERLLIDRELGELPTDSIELLIAYLAAEPSGEQLDRQVCTTLDMARASLAPDAFAAATELPARRSPMILMQQRNRLDLRRLSSSAFRGLAAAAIIVLAFLAGGRTAGVYAPSQLAIETPVRSHSVSADFWSIQRIKQVHRPATPLRATMIWTSPLSLPQLGERS